MFPSWLLSSRCLSSGFSISRCSGLSISFVLVCVEV